MRDQRVEQEVRIEGWVLLAKPELPVSVYLSIKDEEAGSNGTEVLYNEVPHDRIYPPESWISGGRVVDSVGFWSNRPERI